MTYEEYCEKHPVCQSMHTGKWGFGRHADGFNLNSAKYPNEGYAEAARRAAWEHEQAVEECIANGGDPRFDVIDGRF